MFSLASGIPRHVQRMPALDVKGSLGVKEFSEVPGQEISIFFVTHFVSVPSPWSEIRVPDCCVMNLTSSGTPRVRNKMRAKEKQAEPNLMALSLLGADVVTPTKSFMPMVTALEFSSLCCSVCRERQPCLFFFFSLLCQGDAFIWVRCQATSSARTTLLAARIRSLLVTR